MLFVLLPGMARSAEQTRVAVLPFVTHSEADMTYLQQAIPAMLTSRLGKPVTLRSLTGQQFLNRSSASTGLPLMKRKRLLSASACARTLW